MGAPKLKAETTGETAKAWFGLLGAKANECKVQIEENRVWTKLVDPANVMLNHIEIECDEWDHYQYRSPGGILGGNDGTLGVSLEELNGYFKLFTKTESVRFEVDNDAKLKLEGPNFTAIVPSIDPDSVRMEPDLPGLDLPGQAIVESDDLKGTIKEMNEISDHTDLIIYNGTLYFYTENDHDSHIVEVDSIDGAGYADSKFSLDYLCDFYRAYPRGNEDRVEVHAGREFPAHFTHYVHGAVFTMMLAPRITQDDQRVHTQERRDVFDTVGIDIERIENADPRFTINPAEKAEIQSDQPDMDEDENEDESEAPASEEPTDTEVPGDGEKPHDPTDDLTKAFG